MKGLVSIARKDFMVLMRDKAAVLVLIAMPMALIFILGSALGNLESGDFGIEVAIVNLDEGEVGERFVEGLTGTEDLEGLFNITLSADVERVRSDVEQGNLVAALLIPRDTSDRVSAGDSVTLEVVQDPGSPLGAGIWVGVVKAAVSYASAGLILGDALEQQGAGSQDAAPGAGPATGGAPGAAAPAAAAPPSGPQTERALEFDAVQVTNEQADPGESISMISYYSAAMTAMFLLFGSMFGAFAFVKERREQTLSRMLVTPSSKVSIVAGKGLGILFIGLAQLVVLVAGTTLLFRVDWGDSLPAILILGVAEALAATGLAMTLAALGKTERAIGGIGPAVIMLFAATGGSMVPADQLPGWLEPLQVISPSYWTLDGFLEVMRGASPADISFQAAMLVLMAIILYAFGVWRLSYE